MTDGMSGMEFKPYDPAVMGREIVFYAGEDGFQRGEILEAEHDSAGEFLGYTVYVQAVQINYVRVKQRENGRWEMIPVQLT